MSNMRYNNYGITLIIETDGAPHDLMEKWMEMENFQNFEK